MIYSYLKPFGIGIVGRYAVDDGPGGAEPQIVAHGARVGAAHI